MALVKCPDCGKMVSARAEACPDCGCPAEYFEGLESILSKNPDGNSTVGADQGTISDVKKSEIMRLLENWGRYSNYVQDLELKTEVSSLDYDGDPCSKGRSKSLAKDALRRMYDEADRNLKSGFFTKSLREAIDHAESCFDKISALMSQENIQMDEYVQKQIDIVLFKDEIQPEIEAVRVGDLDSFSRYYDMVTYEDYGDGYVYECMEPAWGIRRQFRDITQDYADEVEKIVNRAMNKRKERLVSQLKL